MLRGHPAALASSERLLDQTRHSAAEPAWIDFYHHARLSADAAGNPLGGHTLAIVGTAHLQAKDLDQGLQFGHRAVDILARVQSTRALDYVRELVCAHLVTRPRLHGPFETDRASDQRG